MADQPDKPIELTDLPLPSRSNVLMEAQHAALFTSPQTIAAPKSKAQRQREYRQRIAASRTPAQAIAARKSNAERQRNCRLRKAANSALVSCSLKPTVSSSRSGARSNDVQTGTQRQLKHQQRQTSAAESAQITVQPGKVSGTTGSSNQSVFEPAAAVAAATAAAAASSSSSSGSVLSESLEPPTQPYKPLQPVTVTATNIPIQVVETPHESTATSAYYLILPNAHNKIEDIDQSNENMVHNLDPTDNFIQVKEENPYDWNETENFIEPKEEILDELDVTDDFEKRRDFILGKEELSNTSVHLELDLNKQNIGIPIKIEQSSDIEEDNDDIILKQQADNSSRLADKEWDGYEIEIPIKTEATDDLEENKKVVIPNEELSNIRLYVDHNYNKQNINRVMPIKTELILSDNVVEFRRKYEKL